jgi:hypothetical protein
MFPNQRGIEEIESVLDSCIVTEEPKCFRDASVLLNRVRAAIENLETPTAFQEIVLSTTDGNFRVRVSVKPYELVATPLVPDEKGQWISQQGASGLVSSRWQRQPDGTLIRFM